MLTEEEDKKEVQFIAGQVRATFVRNAVAIAPRRQHPVMNGILATFGHMKHVWGLRWQAEAKEASKYNGWTNYETWLVNMHLTQEEQVNTRWILTAAELLDNVDHEQLVPITQEQWATYTLAERLKGEIVEGSAEAAESEGLYADLVHGALQSVDWLELAAHYITIVKEDRDAEKKPIEPHPFYGTTEDCAVCNETRVHSFHGFTPGVVCLEHPFEGADLTKGCTACHASAQHPIHHESVHPTANSRRDELIHYDANHPKNTDILGG